MIDRADSQVQTVENIVHDLVQVGDRGKADAGQNAYREAYNFLKSAGDPTSNSPIHLTPEQMKQTVDDLQHQGLLPHLAVEFALDSDGGSKFRNGGAKSGSMDFMTSTDGRMLHANPASPAADQVLQSKLAEEFGYAVSGYTANNSGDIGRDPSHTIYRQHLLHIENQNDRNESMTDSHLNRVIHPHNMDRY